MSTFIDPVKIRQLAEGGDDFWKGAAWVLDQQEAAFDMARHSQALNRALDKVAERRRQNWDDDWSPAPRTAA